MNKKSVLIVAAFLLCLLPTEVFAHHAEWMQGRPFVQGLSMPIHGLDHMLVTFAAGMIAAQIGGAALWAIPLSFSIMLLIGGTLNVCGVSIPLAEPVIFGSITVMGALLSFRPKISLLLALVVVGFVATFHGTALIGEAPHNSWFFLFALGCLLAAFALLGAGIGAGLIIKTFADQKIFRYSGWATIAMAGVLCVFPSVNDIVIHFLE